MPKDLSAQQVGLQGRSSATQPKTNVFTGRTRFPMQYSFPNTYRYGHIQPFYYQHTIGDDDIPLFSHHILSTYTLSSPLKDPVTLNKSYFLVDYKSIYPRNWNLMYVEPNKGDDVPADTRLVVSNLISSFAKRLLTFKQYNSVVDGQVATDFLRFVICAENVFSAGSLLSEFNIHLQDFARYYAPDDLEQLDPLSFDTWFDTVFVPLVRETTFYINGDSYKVSENGKSFYKSDNDTYYVPIRRMLELIRSNSFSVQSVDDQLFHDAVDSLYIFDVANFPLNLEIIAAYQLGCAQFFTDSHVDYVYSAELYRDFLETFITSGNYLNFSNYSFTYNGSKRLYDVLSGKVLNLMLNYLTSLELGNSLVLGIYDFLIGLMGHRNSLRFGDYFVTGRTNPYTNSDLTINTAAGVSVVDITRKIQLQRFRNKVGITAQKVGEYARNVLGLENAYDNSYDIPAFLGHKQCFIGGMDIENTGSEQRNANSITTVLKANENVHAFDIHTKRPGIIIGVMSFDVPRTYSKTIDRMHMHQTRYDDYIPDLQFTGDQQIFQRELDATKPVNGIFAYSLRYMEYKQRYSYAAGGAIEALKTWYMITDNKDGNPFSGTIDPDYIRSQPSEFDRFYSDLTGYSLGTYFHFNVKNIIYQKITRDMVLAPEILK